MFVKPQNETSPTIVLRFSVAALMNPLSPGLVPVAGASAFPVYGRAMLIYLATSDTYYQLYLDGQMPIFLCPGYWSVTE
jgi:hypothetical protein